MTTAEVLRAARELYAQAPSHAVVSSCPERDTYCVVTATMRAAFDVGAGFSEANEADATLVRVLGLTCDNDLIAWNADNSTETVLASFDAAIEASS